MPPSLSAQERTCYDCCLVPSPAEVPGLGCSAPAPLVVVQPRCCRCARCTRCPGATRRPSQASASLHARWHSTANTAQNVPAQMPHAISRARRAVKRSSRRLQATRRYTHAVRCATSGQLYMCVTWGGVGGGEGGLVREGSLSGPVIRCDAALMQQSIAALTAHLVGFPVHFSQVYIRCVGTHILSCYT